MLIAYLHRFINCQALYRLHKRSNNVHLLFGLVEVPYKRFQEFLHRFFNYLFILIHADNMLDAGVEEEVAEALIVARCKDHQARFPLHL